MIDSTGGYGALSYWHDTAPMRPASRRIESGASFDVAIVGGGYTGLWTAYHLLEHHPGLSVAILEREEVGFGASGRNGGLAMTKIGHSLHQMLRDHGPDATLAVQRAAEAAVQGLAAVVESEGIDCELRYGGLLTVATNESQERRVRRDLEAARTMKLETVQELSRDEVQSAVQSPTYRMAMAEEHCATLHPAKLARGLADVVERKGAYLFERAGVTAVTDEGHRVRLNCQDGPVFAKNAVIATNAWTAHNPSFERCLIPMYAYIIATEPLNADSWSKVGWEGWHGVQDKRVHLHFSQRTLDGRILWGGRDNITTFRSRIDPRYDHNERIFGLLRESFARTFPQLGEVRFTHAWGGPIAMTPDILPKFGSLSPRVHFGWGYCGHGVAPSFLGGQILGDLVTAQRTERTGLLFVGRNTRRYPAEPMRFVGSYLARRESFLRDEAADAGKSFSQEPMLLRLAKRLFGT